MDLATKIEVILFSEGSPVSRKKLARILNVPDADISRGVSDLVLRKQGSGFSVVQTDTEIALAVSSEAEPVVKELFERELGREIGDAGLEVLAILLYRGPSTRAQIDYIRGVNTSSTIRNLSARGLVERIPNPQDAREYLYRPTAELLAHLGVANGKELPDYAKIAGELASFEEKTPFANDAAGDHATDRDSA